MSHRRIRAHIRAALLLRHAHAERDARLLARRNEARIVLTRKDARHPFLRERRLEEKRGHSRIGHGDGAAMPGLRLRHHVGAGKPRHDSARFRLRVEPLFQMIPGRAVQPLLHRDRHQRVIGGVEFHPVLAMPEAVETLQYRQIGIRLPPEVEHLRAPHRRPKCRQRCARLAPALPLHRLDQRLVAREKVHVLKRRRLVENLMRREIGWRFHFCVHGWNLFSGGFPRG